MQLKPEMIIDEVEEWSIGHYFTPNFSILVLYKFQLLLMDHNRSNQQQHILTLTVLGSPGSTIDGIVAAESCQ